MRVIVDLEQAGQALPYGDTIYSGTIRYEAYRHDGYKASGTRLNESKVKDHLRAFRRFYEREEIPHPFAPILHKWELVAEDENGRTFRFEIREMYDD